MIYGVGHDLLNMDRISRIVEGRSKKRFLHRILTPNEIQALERREARMVEWVAGRFAVKEAVVKAFGCGIGKQIGFQDVEVLPDILGKPHAKLSEAAWDRLGLASGAMRIHVSISHQPGMASAFCVVETV
ncbi:holo-ACP synthase [Paenibacillus sp. ACRRX]|uniref:holo-ACP synthase n=1 Tax=unclassified Paenibacillus TaxID=185978 RepID=UPI001EF57378|nr:holo-ACP synthase [Paenibacillus sp. UMB4589-SE434]MCG7408538.1 holo-ACP synthase [Paenibacillus sp. ACRRX]MDK8182786.1 holo-ACP synthase [Paenibacillus sp. UMB4589-SE434]